MNFITLDDRPLFEGYFRRHPPTISEYSFPGLFIWRHYFQFRWEVRNNCLLLQACPPGMEKPFNLLPVGPEEKVQAVCEELSTAFKEPEGCFMERVPENERTRYFKDAGRFKWTNKPELSDYVCSLAGLDRLQTSAAPAFLPDQFEYRPMNEELARECLELCEDWCVLRDAHRYPGLIGEQKAVSEALIHFDHLDMLGGAVFSAGKLQGFVLGTILNPDTGVIYFSKANSEIRGLMEGLIREFGRRHLEGKKYLNLGPDLGDEAARQLRLAFHPCQILTKYTASI